MPCAVQSVDLLYRCFLVNGDADPRGGLGEALGELADMQPRAFGVGQPAVEAVGADLRSNLALGYEPGLDPETVGHDLVGLAQTLDVSRLGGHFQVARASEMAVDSLVGDELLDRVDRVVVGHQVCLRGVEPVAGDCLPEPDRQARGAHAAVAARCAESHRVLLEDVHIRACARQMQCRREAGQAGPDDRDLDIPTDLGPGPIGALGGGVEPVGGELHVVALSPASAVRCGRGRPLEGPPWESLSGCRSDTVHSSSPPETALMSGRAGLREGAGLLTVVDPTRMVDNRQEARENAARQPARRPALPRRRPGPGGRRAGHEAASLQRKRTHGKGEYRIINHLPTRHHDVQGSRITAWNDTRPDRPSCGRWVTRGGLRTAEIQRWNAIP